MACIAIFIEKCNIHIGQFNEPSIKLALSIIDHDIIPIGDILVLDLDAQGSAATENQH